MVKNLPANAGDAGDMFDTWVKKIPWRRKWEPTPMFLPGESHGQKSLAASWWAKVHRVTESLTQLKQPSMHILSISRPDQVNFIVYNELLLFLFSDDTSF